MCGCSFSVILQQIKIQYTRPGWDRQALRARHRGGSGAFLQDIRTGQVIYGGRIDRLLVKQNKPVNFFH